MAMKRSATESAEVIDAERYRPSIAYGFACTKCGNEYTMSHKWFAVPPMYAKACATLHGGATCWEGGWGFEGGIETDAGRAGGASQGRARAEPLRDRAHDRIQVELGGTPQSVGRPNGRPTIRCAGAD